MEIGEIKLDIIEKYLQYRISEKELKYGTYGTTGFETIIDHVADELYLGFVKNILGEKTQIQYIKYPKDWWEAFKERWFFDWLLRKFPVKYTEYKIDVELLYPYLQIKIPEEKTSVNFALTKTETTID